MRGFVELLVVVTVFCVVPFFIAAPDRRWIAWTLYAPTLLFAWIVIIYGAVDAYHDQKPSQIEVEEGEPAPTTSPTRENRAAN